MSVKINSLEIENVKRVKAVSMEPSENGLTVIGGRNGQGKTSVLDAIAWALGGERNRPGNAKRDGAAGDPALRVELSNGLVVERRGAKSALKVTDPSGARSGQTLLDGFVEQLALNLPKFLAASDSEKAKTLLSIIGVGDELRRLDAEEKALYDRRLATGQMARQKRASAAELRCWPQAPDEPVSASELAERHKAALERNAQNSRMRSEAASLRDRADAAARDAAEAERRAKEAVDAAEAARRAARAAADRLIGIEDVDTSEIERELERIEEINAQVRDNARKADADAEADALDEEYDALSGKIERVREERMALLDGADMPLDGLSVREGSLVYGGQPWDGMSASEQLRVATAIVRRLKPECGFVLVDKLEQMDPQTLEEFGAWAESEGLQVIGTRVAVDDTCQIIIEDGRVAGGPAPADPGAAAGAAAGKWVM